MGTAQAQTLLPTINITADIPSFPWETILMFFLVAMLVYGAMHWFTPWVRLKVQRLRKMRTQWMYQAMVGRQMSVRAKNIEVGEALAATLVQLMDKGVITKKRKRELIRKIEISLLLDQGDLGPKPSQKEVKRRTLGRIKNIHPMTSKMSTASAPAGNIVSLSSSSANGRLGKIISSKN